MFRSLAAVGLCALASAGSAQASPSAAGFECRALKDKTKRLQCYDAIRFEEPAKAAPAAPLPKRWDREPGKFLSIALGEKVEASISAACPGEWSTLLRRNEFAKFKWEKQGKPLCQFLEHEGSVVAGTKLPRWYSVWGSGVDELRDGVRVSTDDEGKANRIAAKFYSSEAATLYAALVQRFGEPTTTEATSMMLNNGATIPGTSSTWVGAHAVLQFSSHASRETYRGITDFGEISFTSIAYLDQKLKARAEDTVKKAEKF